jgi:hypothetical protein
LVVLTTGRTHRLSRGGCGSHEENGESRRGYVAAA